MALNAAPGLRPTLTAQQLKSVRRSASRPRPAGQTAPQPMRDFEVAALRGDGSLYIGQDRAPAIPLFENAFSAYASGTPIRTTQGVVAVEDLQPGDMIDTNTGDPAQLIWVGASSFAPVQGGRRVPLVRIMADTFGQGRPNSFVTLGAAARILHTPDHLRGELGEGRVLTPARDFIDGVNVIEVLPPTPVRLFHICLDRHAVINVGGLEMETYHPGLNATKEVSHNLRDKFLGLFPTVNHINEFGPLAHPRAQELGDNINAI